MVPALQLMRTYIPGMRQRKFGRIINITSAMVKSRHYIMGRSTSARTALTAISKAAGTEIAFRMSRRRTICFWRRLRARRKWRSVSRVQAR